MLRRNCAMRFGGVARVLLSPDIVESFLDRGQLRKLALMTITAPESAFPGSSSTIRGNSPSCALSYASAHRRRQQRHLCPTPPQSRRRPRPQRRPLHPRFPALRSFKTSRQGPRRKAAPLAPLPAPSQRRLNLPRLPEALRTRLRPLDHRLPLGFIASTGRNSTACRRSRQAHSRRWPQSRMTTAPTRTEPPL
jgi:hypothetical protein